MVTQDAEVLPRSHLQILNPKHYLKENQADQRPSLPAWEQVKENCIQTQWSFWEWKGGHTGCVTWGKVLSLSEPHFSHLQTTGKTIPP